jgi:peptide deformylase
MNIEPKLLPVRVYGDAMLRMKALPIRNFDEKLQKIVRDMTHTMYLRDGVGLAATQVGYNQRLFVIDMDYSHENAKPNPIVMINPIIKAGEGEYEMEEGCLSVPGVYAKVKRFNKIIYTYFDINGEEHQEEAEGYKAVVIQHEYDHLNGILFVDKISKLALLKIKRKLKLIEKTAVDGKNIREDIYSPDNNKQDERI